MTYPYFPPPDPRDLLEYVAEYAAKNLRARVEIRIDTIAPCYSARTFDYREKRTPLATPSEETK